MARREYFRSRCMRNKCLIERAALFERYLEVNYPQALFEAKLYADTEMIIKRHPVREEEFQPVPLVANPDPPEPMVDVQQYFEPLNLPQSGFLLTMNRLQTYKPNLW